MTNVIQTNGLSKHYKDVKAVEDLTISFDEHRIHGLLGRNGAGKTTLMQLLTGQLFATAGEIRVFGEDPVENAGVMERTCFIQEGQTYPDGFEARHVLRIAAGLHPRWDQQKADELVALFDLPLDRKIKKLSRGQLSAIGIVTGIASRADLTFFDEPYLGLDAVARQIFYDRLLEDYAEHPRTIILSSHLIDEIADLVDQVILVDDGALILHESTDDLRGRALTLTGDAEAVDQLVGTREVLHRESLGRVASVTVMGSLTDEEEAEARRLGLEHSAVPLQQLIVHLSQRDQRTATRSQGAAS